MENFNLTLALMNIVRRRQQRLIKTEEQILKIKYKRREDNLKFKQLVDQQFYKLLKKKNITKEYVERAIKYPMSSYVEGKLKKILQRKKYLKPTDVMEAVYKLHKGIIQDSDFPYFYYNLYLRQAFSFTRTTQPRFWTNLTIEWEKHLKYLHDKYYGKL